MYCIVIDPKELKRQRDRERYSQNKDEINKRRREAYKHKKDAATNATQTPLTASAGNDDHLRHNMAHLYCNIMTFSYSIQTLARLRNCGRGSGMHKIERKFYSDNDKPASKIRIVVPSPMALTL